MQIINMTTCSQQQIEQAIQLLKDCFPIWLPTKQKAEKIMAECLQPENTMLAAVENGVVIGMCGILAPVYDGNVFELHPLAVRTDYRKQGIGKALVRAVETEARKQGGKTIYLGCDDDGETGKTSLANVDLYADLPGKLNTFEPGTHAHAFYLKVGYKLIGVMPDASGTGKPDIFFGKRL